MIIKKNANNLVEIELNLYELSDASNEIDLFMLKVNQNLVTYTSQNNKYMIIEMLKTLIYAEEVSKHISIVIELADRYFNNSITDLPEFIINYLIRRTRRDMFFTKKARKYLNDLINYNPDSEEPNPFIVLEKPQWIRKVIIDQEKIDQEVNLISADISVDETNEFLRAIENRILGEINDHESFRRSRQTFTVRNSIRLTQNAFRDTTALLQEYDLNLNLDLSEIESKDEEFDEENLLMTVNIQLEEVVNDNLE